MVSLLTQEISKLEARRTARGSNMHDKNGLKLTLVCADHCKGEGIWLEGPGNDAERLFLHSLCLACRNWAKFPHPSLPANIFLDRPLFPH